MEEFVSESDSDYTSYWRDWVCQIMLPCRFYAVMIYLFRVVS